VIWFPLSNWTAKGRAIIDDRWIENGVRATSHEADREIRALIVVV
jgi:hypothetical protein